MSAPEPATSDSQADGATAKPKPAKVKAPRTKAELEAALVAIKGDTSLKRPIMPVMPTLPATMSMKRKLHAIQRYISSFEYNYTGKLYFNVRRDAGLQKLMIQAKAIMRMALPIQCMEALFLATYLTLEYKQMLRVPLSFKSSVEGHTFRHIVLAVECEGVWGAIGMSRKKTLMHKDLVYPSLSALVKEYIEQYQKIWHQVLKVYVGFPFAHDTFCQARLQWRVLRLRADMNEWSDMAAVLDAYAKVADSFFQTYLHSGTMPAAIKKDYSLFTPGDDSDTELVLPPKTLPGANSAKKASPRSSRRTHPRAATAASTKRGSARTRKQGAETAGTSAGLAGQDKQGGMVTPPRPHTTAGGRGAPSASSGAAPDASAAGNSPAAVGASRHTASPTTTATGQGAANTPRGARHAAQGLSFTPVRRAPAGVGEGASATDAAGAHAACDSAAPSSEQPASTDASTVGGDAGATASAQPEEPHGSTPSEASPGGQVAAAGTGAVPASGAAGDVTDPGVAAAVQGAVANASDMPSAAELVRRASRSNIFLGV